MKRYLPKACLRPEGVPEAMERGSSVPGVVPAVGSSAAGTVAPAAGTQCGTKYGETPPAWDHVTVIIFENKTLSQIIGSANAPYLTSLARACSYATDMPSRRVTVTSIQPTPLTTVIAARYRGAGRPGPATV